MSDTSATVVRTLTPNEFAARYRVSPDRVRALIRAGKLRALNLAASRVARPKFVIPPEAVREFEAAHSAAPPPKAARRKRASGMVDYFPD
jgi:hypothetical protein